MDISPLIPIIAALLGGGAVALYLARPRKDSLAVETSKNALEIVDAALERLEDDMKDRDERVAQLEAELGKEMYKVSLLAREVTRLGGDATAVLGGTT